MPRHTVYWTPMPPLQVSCAGRLGFRTPTGKQYFSCDCMWKSTWFIVVLGLVSSVLHAALEICQIHWYLSFAQIRKGGAGYALEPLGSLALTGF